MIPANPIANTFGFTFVLVGILGFVPNPIVAPNGIFVVNTAHNLLHVIVGIAFFAGAWVGQARNTILALSVIGVAIAALGFATSGDMLLGVLHVNDADRWVHALFAGVVLASWWISRQPGASRRSAKSPAKK